MKSLEKKMLFDSMTLSSLVVLLALGWLMMFSASLSVTERYELSVFYFAIHQGIAILLGIAGLVLITYLPLKYLQKSVLLIFSLSFLLLFLLLIPGFSRPFNGSVRWFTVFGVSIQISEMMKLAFILYLADYLHHHIQFVRTHFSVFLKPLGVFCCVSVLLFLEPDFGSIVVLFLITLSLLFLSGVKLNRFMGVFVFSIVLLVGFAMYSPYRVSRVMAFLDPWADPYQSGYQLTQSLIAFGQGGWFGQGLGESLQKCHFLPEPHTDFIFAILAEELGLTGVIFTLGIVFILTLSIFNIAKRAISLDDLFGGFVAYGVGLWISVQTLISAGVNTGLLPTKGLTFPFMSYGGSSVFMLLIGMGIVFRVDFETKRKL